MDSFEKTISSALNEHSGMLEGFRTLGPKIKEIAELLAAAAKDRRHLFICGNGGSAADSQHMAAEYIGRLEQGKDLHLPATALTVNTSNLTALGNDFGFENIFSLQIKSLAKAGDVLIGISTSGNAKNVLNAVETAKKMGLVTIGFTGGDGGALAKAVDHALIIPAQRTSRIQEGHELLIHILCDLVALHIK